MIDPELWLNRFCDWMTVKQWSPRTVKTYACILGRFLNWLAARRVGELSQVTRTTLQDYRMHLFYERTRGRALAPVSQVRRLSAVKTFFRFLEGEGWLLVDPAAGLELPRVPRTLPRTLLSESEVLQILEAPDIRRPLGLRDRALLELLYSTAVRNSELRSLTLEDVHADGRLLVVRQGKGGKSRVVPLGEEAVFWLGRYLERGRPRLVRSSSERVLFVGQHGQALRSTWGLAQLVARAARRAGLTRPVTPHAFRHACATHMLRHGAGLRHLQELLGHASAGTTQRYTRVEVSDLRRVHRRCHPRERRGRKAPGP
ncbi:MAG: tyrosine-type recombinase/integrase [Candidatus Eremiobacterota bacterium]